VIRDFKKITGASIEHPKQRGEWAELRFMARASEYGLCVSKPWGDSRRYDFIVEHDGKFVRVQVKSTTHRRSNSSYLCQFHNRVGQPFTSKQFDFVAVYIIPKNIWYIFPVDLFLNGRNSVCLSPHLKDSKHGTYLEAWHLLRGDETSTHTG
jgi:hypothetical protein